MARSTGIIAFFIVLVATAMPVLSDLANKQVLFKRIRDVQQEVFNTLMLNSSEIIQESMLRVGLFLTPVVCPFPFEIHGGLCLYYNRLTLTWPAAEKFCLLLDGHLAGMRNRLEHNAIRGFAREKGHISYFWIGLHRKSYNRDLVWSNGIESNYRGDPLKDEDETYFSADSRDLSFDGDGDAMRSSSICRFQHHNITKADPVHLLTVLEHNRMLLEDVVIHMGVKTIEKVSNEMDKFAKAIRRELVECPYPWIRTEGMCLMYIFQLRTWPDAIDLCTANGGTLVWFENDKEHNFIRDLRWARHKRIYRYFWTGLHRENNGNLIWSGHCISNYRGKPFVTGSNAMYFAANRESTQIDGSDEDAKFSAVCRRPLQG